MDERLVKALEFSNRNLTLQMQRANLKLRVERLLTYSINGGTFRITPDLIGFVYSCLLSGDQDAVLQDINGLPIQISNLTEFYDTIRKRYREVNLEYLQEYTKIKQARSVSQLVELKDE